MLAAGPPLRGRPRRAPSRGPDSNPWAPAAANPSASRRGQAGNPLVPGYPVPQGHGQRRSAVRRRLPRCFRCTCPRGRSSARARPSTCPSPWRVVGPLEPPSLAPQASPSPHPQPSPRLLALRGWRSRREAAGSVYSPGVLITSPTPLPRLLPDRCPSLLLGSTALPCLPKTALAKQRSPHPESQDTVLLGEMCGTASIREGLVENPIRNYYEFR
ncbi:hypothetical protein NN561_019685 [Cricetulus griseus]